MLSPTGHPTGSGTVSTESDLVQLLMWSLDTNGDYVAWHRAVVDRLTRLGCMTDGQPDWEKHRRRYG